MRSKTNYLEAVEEYSEGKIRMSEPDQGTEMIRLCSLLIRPGKILKSVTCAESVYDE